MKETVRIIQYMQGGLCCLDVVRFNKLGLDKITSSEEPNPLNQVEEVHSYTPVQSAPLSSEKIVHIDIGTAHSVAVTGKIVISLIYHIAFLEQT